MDSIKIQNDKLEVKIKNSAAITFNRLNYSWQIN